MNEATKKSKKVFSGFPFTSKDLCPSCYFIAYIIHLNTQVLIRVHCLKIHFIDVYRCQCGDYRESYNKIRFIYLFQLIVLEFDCIFVLFYFILKLVKDQLLFFFLFWLESTNVSQTDFKINCEFLIKGFLIFRQLLHII